MPFPPFFLFFFILFTFYVFVYIDACHTVSVNASLLSMVDYNYLVDGTVGDISR
jgi:hypothetical protein